MAQHLAQTVMVQRVIPQVALAQDFLVTVQPPVVHPKAIQQSLLLTVVRAAEMLVVGPARKFTAALVAVVAVAACQQVVAVDIVEAQQVHGHHSKPAAAVAHIITVSIRTMLEM